MKNIKRKLRSRSGASLLIALVFLLFCAFVGGSVFASATANAYRVDHLSDQQAFLAERSAALLLSDELRLESGSYLRLSVTDSDVTTQEIEIMNGGWQQNKGDPSTGREITFNVVTDIPEISGLQKLMLEATVLRYLLENDYSAGDKVILTGFPGDPASIDAFTIKQKDGTTSLDGAMTVTSPLGDYSANVTSGTGDLLYDFQIQFSLADQESHMRVSLDAYAGTTAPQTVTTITNLENKDVRLTSNFTQTMIYWDDPFVEKGGANG